MTYGSTINDPRQHTEMVHAGQTKQNILTIISPTICKIVQMTYAENFFLKKLQMSRV